MRPTAPALPTSRCRLAAWAALAACMTACPGEVPDPAKFSPADATSGVDSTGLADAGTDAPGDAIAATDAATDAPTVADAALPSDATAGPDAKGADAGPDTPAAPDAPVPVDAGCPKNGCAATGDPCQVAACHGDGTCKTTPAADGVGCGGKNSCQSGFCIAPPPKVEQFAAGGGTTCARLDDGSLRCFGDGAEGQLGNGKAGGGTQSASPVTVAGVTGATDVACGDTHCCAVVGVKVRCWGRNEFGAIDPGLPAKGPVATAVEVGGISGAVQVAAGSHFSCAIVAAGKVRCWGLGSAGQLGDGKGFATKTVTDVSLSEPAVAVRAGLHFACARTAQGKAWCWGSNEYGQLGNGGGGTGKDSMSPVPVSGLDQVAAIAAGGEFACAVRKDGTAACWGRNQDGAALGAGGGNIYSTTPKAVVGVVDGLQVAAGDAHGCILRKGFDLVCWGRNAQGQLGAPNPSVSNVPIAVPGLTGLAGVTAGATHTCAWSSAGKGWCWGSNGFGEAGQAGSGAVTAPAAVF